MQGKRSRIGENRDNGRDGRKRKVRLLAGVGIGERDAVTNLAACPAVYRRR